MPTLSSFDGLNSGLTELVSPLLPEQAMVQSLGPRVKDLGESKAVLDVFENPADVSEVFTALLHGGKLEGKAESAPECVHGAH